MFTAKQETLFKKTSATPKEQNVFVQKGLKKTSETRSGNGALKYSTSGNPAVDQFTFLGSYKAPRSYNEIAADCETLWAFGKITCVLFMFYIRTITRVVNLFNGAKTKTSQKGAELKHEGIMRMIWLHSKDPNIFWANVGLFICLGSWKDIITMLQYDLVYNGWEGRVLNWEEFGKLILTYLDDKGSVELIKKYLPQIKSNNQCTTVESQADNIIGKWICSLLFGNKESSANYKRYRKLKSSGTAHEWQKLISQRKFDLIDFSKIHGRALSLLVRSKFLKKQGLSEKYEAWVTKPETEVKYTGFVHELFGNMSGSLTRLSKGEQETINKQFYTLVEKGKSQDKVNSLIVVRDTSGSMASTATGTNVTCFNIAKALALYFSEFLKGKFSTAWIEFNKKAKMHEWSGNSPLEKWYNDHSTVVGNTDFMSVIDLFCELKKDISEEDFPTGILCISDGEFDPSQLDETNVQSALKALSRAGFSDEYVRNFVIVLWNLQSNAYGKDTGKKFETHGKVDNVFYFSGYSASVISFLSSKIKNAEDLFNEAMDQEILNMIKI